MSRLSSLFNECTLDQGVQGTYRFDAGSTRSYGARPPTLTGGVGVGRGSRRRVDEDRGVTNSYRNLGVEDPPKREGKILEKRR